MTIRIWRTDQLVSELSRGTLPSRDSRNYMLAAALLYTMTVYGSLAFGAERNWMLALQLALTLTISMIGVNECYRANGAEQGQEFILRLSALSVPLGFRFWAAQVAVRQLDSFFLQQLTGQGTFRDPDLVYQYLDFIVPLALTFIFYWRLTVHLKRVQIKAATRQNAA